MNFDSLNRRPGLQQLEGLRLKTARAVGFQMSTIAKARARLQLKNPI